MEAFFTFSSLTAAQKGRYLLQKAGIPVKIRKYVHPQTGCFYRLAVPQEKKELAGQLLSDLSVYKARRG